MYHVLSLREEDLSLGAALGVEERAGQDSGAVLRRLASETGASQDIATKLPLIGGVRGDFPGHYIGSYD